MALLQAEDEKLKRVFKDALGEVLEERKDLLREILEEAVEDFALARAIEEGRLAGKTT